MADSKEHLLKNNTEMESLSVDTSYTPTSTDINHNDMKLVVIYEECIDKTTENIEVSVSWVNASLFQAALHDTNVLFSSSILANYWFDCIVSIILGIILILVPMMFEKIITMMNHVYEEHEISKNETIKRYIGKKTESEVTYFRSRFVDVAIFTSSCVISMTVRDAAKLSFESIYDINEIDSAIYFLYSIIWTIVGIVFTVKLSNYIEKYQKTVKDKVDILINENNEKSLRKLLRKYLLHSRFINLGLTTVSFCMAWSWRTSISNAIISLYNGEQDTPYSVWIYVGMVMIFITLYKSIIEHFYCIYPRKERIQRIYNNKTYIKKVGELIDEQCLYVAAFAWSDAIKVTIFVNVSENNVGERVFLFWFVTILVHWICIILLHYNQKRKMTKKIEEMGIALWIDVHIINKMENMLKYGTINNKNNNLNIDDEILCLLVCNSYFGKFIELLIESGNIAAGLSFINAASYTIAAAYYDTANFDLNSPNNIGTDALALQWTIVPISFIITGIIFVYLKRVILKIRQERIILMHKIVNIKRYQEYKHLALSNNQTQNISITQRSNEVIISNDIDAK